jgi:hypothetical protein
MSRAFMNRSVSLYLDTAPFGVARVGRTLAADPIDMRPHPAPIIVGVPG